MYVRIRIITHYSELLVTTLNNVVGKAVIMTLSCWQSKYYSPADCSSDLPYGSATFLTSDPSWKKVWDKIHVSIKDIVLYLLPIPMLNQCIFVLYHCGPVVLASFSDRSTSDQTSHFSTLFILINSKRQTNVVAWKTNVRAFNVTYNDVDLSFLNQSSCYNQLFGAGLPWSLQWFMCNTGFS